MQPDAVLFDFDGVVVESAAIKTDAFRALFAQEPRLDEIVSLHERHAGVSRHVKFEMIYRDLLGRALPDAEKQALADRFQALVMERVIACPMVAGARELLEALRGRVPAVVVSGTPQDELNEIVERRSLSRYFVSLHGSPRRKPDIVRELLASNGWQASRVTMIGDALEDQQAAQANAVNFIGRVARGAKNLFPAGTKIVEDLAPVPAMLGLTLAAAS